MSPVPKKGNDYDQAKDPRDPAQPHPSRGLRPIPRCGGANTTTAVPGGTAGSSAARPVSSPATQNQQLVYVRAKGNPESALPTIRKDVHELGPELPILNLKTLKREVDESLVTDRMIATLSAVFGVRATILATVGLYGVTAYTVTRRPPP